MTSLHTGIRRLEGLDELDAYITPVSASVTTMVKPTWVRNLLSGTWLGQPVHPTLVSIPIGAWVSSMIFDLVGGKQGDRAASVLIATGVVAAVPTAATGLNDWSDTQGPTARVGAIHSAANSVALGMYLGSLFSRSRGKTLRGKALSWAGTLFVGAGGYLGGHLTYARATNVNHAAWSQIPTEWARVAAETDLPEDGMLRAERDGVPILLSRAGGHVSAIAAVCSHMGGALDEGDYCAGRVTCPLHGSVFRLSDGSVVRGPASSPQPAYEARIVDDAVEVRASQ